MKNSYIKTIKSCYKICPSCGNFTLNTLHDVYCIVCGEKLINECPECREPIIYPTAKYCPVCGTSLDKKDLNNEKAFDPH